MERKGLDKRKTMLNNLEMPGKRGETYGELAQTTRLKQGGTFDVSMEGRRAESEQGWLRRHASAGQAVGLQYPQLNTTEYYSQDEGDDLSHRHPHQGQRPQFFVSRGNNLPLHKSLTENYKDTHRMAGSQSVVQTSDYESHCDYEGAGLEDGRLSEHSLHSSESDIHYDRRKQRAYDVGTSFCHRGAAQPHVTDNKFHVRVRTIHKVIRVAQSVYDIEHNMIPLNVVQQTKQLADIKTPYCPSGRIRNQIAEIANEWEEKLAKILHEHFEVTLAKAVISLPHMTQDNWQGPFEVAKMWASRSLGDRLRHDTVERTRALIMALAEDCEEDHSDTTVSSDSPLQTGGLLGEDSPLSILEGPPTPGRNRNRNLAKKARKKWLKAQGTVSDGRENLLPTSNRDISDTGLQILVLPPYDKTQKAPLTAMVDDIQETEWGSEPQAYKLSQFTGASAPPIPEWVRIQLHSLREDKTQTDAPLPGAQREEINNEYKSQEGRVVLPRQTTEIQNNVTDTSLHSLELIHESGTIRNRSMSV